MQIPRDVEGAIPYEHGLNNARRTQRLRRADNYGESAACRQASRPTRTIENRY